MIFATSVLGRASLRPHSHSLYLTTESLAL